MSVARERIFLCTGWKLHFRTAWILASALLTKLWDCGQITSPLGGLSVHIWGKWGAVLGGPEVPSSSDNPHSDINELITGREQNLETVPYNGVKDGSKVGGTGKFLTPLWISSGFGTAGPSCVSVQVGPCQGPSQGGEGRLESSFNFPC